MPLLARILLSDSGWARQSRLQQRKISRVIRWVESNMKLSLGLKLVAFLLGSAVANGTETTTETITIRNDGDNTYYEFRIQGEITEIKVVPNKGATYYLIPSQQVDGEFVRKDNPKIRVPSWVIFRW